jgi:hypothetical protein
VELGRISLKDWGEVKDGLSPEDRVVVEIPEGLRAGMAVLAQEKAMPVTVWPDLFKGRK